MLSIEHELCAFALSIALVCHIVTHENSRTQFSADELATELNYLAFGQRADFYVNALALQHGICRFKHAIQKMNLVTITKMNPSNGIPIIPKYYSLEPILAGYDITFSTITSGIASNEVDALEAILNMRNNILRMSKEVPSLFKCQSSVMARIFMTIENAVPLFSHKSSEIVLRQNFEDLGPRMQNKHRKRYLEDTEDKYGKNNVIPLMRFSLEKAEKEFEKRARLGSVAKPLFPGDQDDDQLNDIEDKDSSIDENDARYNDDVDSDSDHGILGDERINNVLEKIRNRNIKYTVKEKAEVLTIFDIIKAVLEEQIEKGLISRNVDVNTESANLTKATLLNKGGGFAGINPIKIHRWNRIRNDETKKRGKKVDKSFEKEVMAGLVICVLDEITDKV